MSDKELEKINAKKFRELKKKYLFKTPLQDDVPKKQEPKISPRDVLIKRLYDRGLDVLVAAETQFPQETNLIINQLIQIIDSQKIGNIVLGTFNLMSHGMEHWHPNPDFFFKPGAGPVFDVGVYYITQLVNFLGPVESIISVSGSVTKERTITGKIRNGEKIKVETPTTLMGVLHFTNKAKVQFFVSWDVWKHKHSTIELYGTQGSMILPDPNFFGGKLLLSNKESDWESISTETMLLGEPNQGAGDYMVANYRGIGLSDMVNCIKQNIKPRCSLDLALHVLEIMDGILISAKSSKKYQTLTKCKRPKALNEEEIKSLLTIL